MSKFEIDEAPEVAMSNPTNDELFEQAKEALELEKISEKIWAEKTEEERWAIEHIIWKLLIYMGENMGEWLPSSLVKFEDTALDVHFRILLHQVSQVVNEQEIKEAEEQRTAMRELAESLGHPLEA